MPERKKIDLHTYMTAESVPDTAMASVDALDLARQMAEAHIQIPMQVWDEVDTQLNPDQRSKWRCIAEDYFGRLRIRIEKRERLPWQGRPDLSD